MIILLQGAPNILLNSNLNWCRIFTESWVSSANLKASICICSFSFCVLGMNLERDAISLESDRHLWGRPKVAQVHLDQFGTNNKPANMLELIVLVVNSSQASGESTFFLPLLFNEYIAGAGVDIWLNCCHTVFYKNTQRYMILHTDRGLNVYHISQEVFWRPPFIKPIIWSRETKTVNKQIIGEEKNKCFVEVNDKGMK